MTRSYSDKFAIAAARHSSAARRGIFDTDIFLTAFVNAVFCFYAGGQSTEYCGRKPDALCQYMTTLPISWDMINAQASTLTVVIQSRTFRLPGETSDIYSLTYALFRKILHSQIVVGLSTRDGFPKNGVTRLNKVGGRLQPVQAKLLVDRSRV